MSEEKEITLVRAVQTSIACPSQWDAWDEEGNYYYLRFRSGCGAISKFPDENWVNARPTPKREHIADFEVEDEWAGVISLEEFAEKAGIKLSPDLVKTGFGDHMAEQLVIEHGLPMEAALKVTEPWRRLKE